jgi:hypothetical protein
MSFATICSIIATFLFAVGALLVVLNEADLGGLNPLEWALLGLPFFGLGHWIPGSTR